MKDKPLRLQRHKLKETKPGWYDCLCGFGCNTRQAESQHIAEMTGTVEEYEVRAAVSYLHRLLDSKSYSNPHEAVDEAFPCFNER